MSIEKTEGIVLKTIDFRETSLIVTFYTKEFGKLKGILKGIRKEPKKFASTVEVFSSNEIIFYQSRNNDLHLISQCDLIDNFSLVRNNLRKLYLADYAIELIDNLVACEDKNETVFYLLLRFLEELSCDNNNIDRLFCIFQIKALELSGFKPNIEYCISCKKAISNGARFSLSYGGFICRDCILKDNSARKVLEGTIASLIYISANDWESLRRFKLNLHIKNEIKNILDNFITFHLEKKLKSVEFIDTLCN